MGCAKSQAVSPDAILWRNEEWLPNCHEREAQQPIGRSSSRRRGKRGASDTATPCPRAVRAATWVVVLTAEDM